MACAPAASSPSAAQTAGRSIGIVGNLELIPRVRAAELLAIVNGLTPGDITRALRGEHVGTIVHAD